MTLIFISGCDAKTSLPPQSPSSTASTIYGSVNLSDYDTLTEQIQVQTASKSENLLNAVCTIIDVNTLPKAVQLNYTQLQSEPTAEDDINFYLYIVDSSDAPVANLLLYSPGAWAESKESNHIYGSYQASTATGLAKFSVPAQDLDYISTLVLVSSDGFSVVAEKYVGIDLREIYQQNGSPVIKAVWDEITPN